jgi:hypothetical protein
VAVDRPRLLRAVLALSRRRVVPNAHPLARLRVDEHLICRLGGIRPTRRPAAAAVAVPAEERDDDADDDDRQDHPFQDVHDQPPDQPCWPLGGALVHTITRAVP